MIIFTNHRHRYDHHQKTFSDTYNSLDSSKKWVTKLSSAGLVYVHFGREVLATLLGKNQDDQIVDKVLDKVYEGFVEVLMDCPSRDFFLQFSRLRIVLGD